MPVTRKSKYWVSNSGLSTDKDLVEFQIRYVDSSNIEFVGWPVSGEPLMIVQFKGSFITRYAYMPVSRQRAVACAYAPSSGIYLNNKIKDKFKVVRIR